jgi:hypothetical protein
MVCDFDWSLLLGGLLEDVLGLLHPVGVAVELQTLGAMRVAAVIMRSKASPSFGS